MTNILQAIMSKDYLKLETYIMEALNQKVKDRLAMEKQEFKANFVRTIDEDVYAEFGAAIGGAIDSKIRKKSEAKAALKQKEAERESVLKKRAKEALKMRREKMREKQQQEKERLSDKQKMERKKQTQQAHQSQKTNANLKKKPKKPTVVQKKKRK